MEVIKEFLDVVNKEKIISLPKERSRLIYFLDKTVLESWLEGKDSKSIYVRIFMDLLYYITAKFKKKLTIIPVDVLIALKKDGNREVNKKAFKKWISGLAKIMQVDPDKDLSSEEAISSISKEYSKEGYTCCIVTLDESLYGGVDKTKITVVTPTQIILTLVLYYSITPENFKKIILEWLGTDTSN